MTANQAVRVVLPTPYGVFQAHAFEQPSGFVYVALVVGDVEGGSDVLVRLHSECLTGDALGSLRCDCGVQLRQSLRMIAAERRGVLVYVTDHEGRGIGLVNKLRAYLAQDRGADTVDANRGLGLPIDARQYGEAAAVLAALGVRSVRLLTNNPQKVTALRAAGMSVGAVIPLPTAAHHRNAGYLATKAARMNHLRPAGPPLAEATPDAKAVDVLGLLGSVEPSDHRPAVVLKFAQTIDGRIATSTGDARWISGEPERRVSHALRAACDGVLVGVGTVIQDDPQLTVRMVPGASPTRVVLDSNLRLSSSALVLSDDAATIILTTERSTPEQRAALRASGVTVEVVATDDDGRVDLHAALAHLRSSGMELLLVEGGAGVITSLLHAGLADRIIVAVAPLIIGAGTEAVDGLGIGRITDGIHLTNRSIVPIGDDVLLAWDIANGHRPR